MAVSEIFCLTLIAGSLVIVGAFALGFRTFDRRDERRMRVTLAVVERLCAHDRALSGAAPPARESPFDPEALHRREAATARPPRGERAIAPAPVIVRVEPCASPSPAAPPAEPLHGDRDGETPTVQGIGEDTPAPLGQRVPTLPPPSGSTFRSGPSRA